MLLLPTTELIRNKKIIPIEYFYITDIINKEEKKKVYLLSQPQIQTLITFLLVSAVLCIQC